MSPAATPMNMEIVIQNEVREKQSSYDIATMWNLKKMVQTKLFTKQKQSHKCREQTYDYWGWGAKKGEG